MLGKGSELYEWTINHCSNGQTTQDKMLILSVNGEFDLGELLGSEINKNQAVEEIGGWGFVIQGMQIVTSPQRQVFYLNRTYRKYQRSQRRTNFLSQRNIRIPMYLGLIYQSKFKAAICVDTKSTPHYFAITREKSATDKRYYFVRYDGLAKSPEILIEEEGKQLIERMGIMLFYQKIRRVDNFIYENNRY